VFGIGVIMSAELSACPPWVETSPPRSTENSPLETFTAAYFAHQTTVPEVYRQKRIFSVPVRGVPPEFARKP
jgi:hypothetical protein